MAVLFGQQPLHALPGDQRHRRRVAVRSHQYLFQGAADLDLILLGAEHSHNRRSQGCVRLD
jgi:hypothetical protein